MASKKDSRIARAAAERKQTGDMGGTQLSAVDPRTLHRFIDGALRNGALVSFSRTKNGSAAVLTILHDDLPNGQYKDYFDEQGLCEEVERWAGVFGE